MPNVKLVINPINVPDYVVIVVEKVENLGTEITRQDIPGNTQANLTFASLDPVMYRFFFWQSSDATALDTLLGSADIDASIASDAIFEVYELTVDGGGPFDPADQDTEIEIADLDGVLLAVSGSPATGPSFQVFQRGVGPKIAGEIEDFSAAGRGFRLLNGDKFYSGDVWIVNAFRKVASLPVTGISFPDDVLAISAATTSLDLTHLNKELELTGAMAVQELDFPDLAGVSDKKYYLINTHRFTGNYAKLDFSAGGSLWFNGSQVTPFYMAAGEEIGIVIKSGVARILFYHGNASVRGRLVADFKTRVGHIYADGTEYTQAQLPALYDFVVGLPPGAAVSFTDWALSSVVDGKTVYPNKGCFALDTGTTSIKVPDARNMFTRFLKLAADTERITNQPGGYQADVLKSHTHATTYKLGRSDETESGVSTGYLKGPATGGGNYGTLAVTSAATGNATETRSENIGQIPLITL